MLIPSGLDQPAAETASYSFAPEIPYTVYRGQAFAPLPPDLLLSSGWSIATSTAGLQAGDVFETPTIWVEEYVAI
jgi:hypothetical protein